MKSKDQYSVLLTNLRSRKLTGVLFFQSHNRVSLKLHSKFQSLVDKWNKDNVTPDMVKQCDDWLMGRLDDLKDCGTYCDVVDKPEVSPYYPYNKYTVEYYKPDPPPTTTVNGTK